MNIDINGAATQASLSLANLIQQSVLLLSEVQRLTKENEDLKAKLADKK
jgi:hypothetical protein